MGSGWGDVGGVAAALLSAWSDAPTPESAERLCLELGAWCEMAAEGACRMVGLGVCSSELVSSFWARVLLSDAADALVVDLIADFEEAAARWFLECARELVDELAESGIGQGSPAWRMLVALGEDPATVPEPEACATLVALHQLPQRIRRALVAWRVYGDDISEVVRRHELTEEEIHEAVAECSRRADDILRGMP